MADILVKNGCQIPSALLSTNPALVKKNTEIKKISPNRGSDGQWCKMNPEGNAPKGRLNLRSRGGMGASEAESPLLEQYSTSQRKELAKMQEENRKETKYCLTIFKEGIFQEVTEQEFAEFRKLCPLVAQILANPALLAEIPEPISKDPLMPMYDSWEKAAKRLITQLWRVPSAQLFHNPVDPDRLGIPDYFEVVKDPIDFGTIKQRLQHNVYFTMQEVIDDIQRCFDNCMLYNGEDSPVGVRCIQVIKEFHKLYEQLTIGFYLDLIPLNATMDDVRNSI